MDVIVKNSDDSYFYLFKNLNSKNTMYTDDLPNTINKLIFKKLDTLGYIQDTNVLLEDVLKYKSVEKIYIEEETMSLLKILKKYNVKYSIFNKSNYYKDELCKIKSFILLRFILDENKQSIYNLKFLILGENNLSNNIINLLKKLNAHYDVFNSNITNITLINYDIIINTSSIYINPELLFNVKKSLIIYDLEPINSKIDYKLLDNNYIKYRYINNVSLYLPIAKANLLESMCEYESI